MKLRYLLLALLTSPVTASITIEGVVSDKHGKPVKECDVFFNKNAWIDEDSVHVMCDPNGFYSAVIEPGHYNSVYVCDEKLYGKSKLEFWGWNLHFTESQTLNAQFDKMEVFSLATWASNGGSNSLFASFRPMSLDRAKQPIFRDITHNEEKITLFDILPTIDVNSIHGFVDGKPIRLLNYSWTYEKVERCGSKQDVGESGCYMPMIVAQFSKPVLSKGMHTLKINVIDSENGDFGQGITHFMTNDEGLGF